MGTFYNGSDFEGKWDGSEVTDIECQEGHLTESEKDSEADYSSMTDDESDYQNECVIKSDDVVSSCNEVILVDVLREHFRDESGCFEAQSDDSDSKLDMLRLISGSQESSQSLNCNQIPLNEDAFEESKTSVEENGQSETEFLKLRATSEDTGEKSRVVEADNLIPETDPPLGDDEANNCTSKTTDGALNDEQNHPTLQDDGDEMEDTEDATKDSSSSEQIAVDSFSDETQNNLSEGHSESSNVLEDQNLEKGQSKSNSFKHSSSKDDKFNSAEERTEVDKIEVEDNTESDAEDALTQQPDFCDNRKWTTRCKKRIKDEEESRTFNPREPNYLLLASDPEGEKVDLRHQMMDERKNAEEWMIDYHLQQAVTQLAPARKRKVAVLVQAFKTVMPTSKYEPQLRNTTAFVHARPMQACS